MKKLTTILLTLILILTPCLASCRDKSPENEALKYADEARTAALAQRLRENMPRVDGSTSTLPLDIAVRAAIFGISKEEAAKAASHTKTWESLNNLTNGKCDIIIRTPLSKDERASLKASDFEIEEYPVSSEGFVFVINGENPVDTLTVQQLKDIYSGKITNWEELGGADLPIIPYQRNRDSGSQNYMIDFMGDTPLMEPITEDLPATMSGILDAIANYDNAAGAIGYSVYAYSDGMYEDMAKIKYIKVNGIEPSTETIADGTYPIIGYNYAILAADEEKDSPARNLAEWMQSDAGQKVIASAGYVPFRQIEGLDLVPPSQGELYQAAGSGAPLSDADYYYEGTLPAGQQLTLADAELNKTVNDYISAQWERVNAISDEEIKEFSAKVSDYQIYTSRTVKVSVLNGCLSVLSGIEYDLGAQDSVGYFYKSDSAVFDLFSGKRLELSDLFPEGSDFVPELNAYLAKKATEPYSGFGATHEMLKDFSGLRKGEFIFTADSIIFNPGQIFVNGVRLSLRDFIPKMSVSQPRDAGELFPTGEIEIEKKIYTYTRQQLGSAEEYQNGNDDDFEITIWYLDSEKGLISPEVCQKVNSFVLDFYENNLTPEKLLELAELNGIERENIESFSVGPWPDYDITLYGKQYLEFRGPNAVFITEKDGKSHELFIAEDGEYYFSFYFDYNTASPQSSPQTKTAAY